MMHLKAIEIIARSLRASVKGDAKAREEMALGQYVAGMGFSNVGLGIDHSMAHTLSAFYDTPHGVACAILLPTVMEYNARIVSPICKNQAGEEQEKGQSKNPVPALAQGTYLFRRITFTIIPCFQGILELHQTLS